MELNYKIQNINEHEEKYCLVFPRTQPMLLMKSGDLIILRHKEAENEYEDLKLTFLTIVKKIDFGSSIAISYKFGDKEMEDSAWITIVEMIKDILLPVFNVTIYKV